MFDNCRELRPVLIYDDCFREYTASHCRTQSGLQSSMHQSYKVIRKSCGLQATKLYDVIRLHDDVPFYSQSVPFFKFMWRFIV